MNQAQSGRKQAFDRVCRDVVAECKRLDVENAVHPECHASNQRLIAEETLYSLILESVGLYEQFLRECPPEEMKEVHSLFQSGEGEEALSKLRALMWNHSDCFRLAREHGYSH